VPGQRDHLANYQDALLAPSYSPIGRSHHSAPHFNHNVSQNLGYEGMREGMRQQQPYQQDHARYGNYHPQTYHYQNQYDPHMMQQSYDSGLDYYYQGQDMMDSHNDDPLSLMWSDESAKTMKMKNMSMNGGYNGDHNVKPKMHSGYGAPEQDRDVDRYHDMKGGQVVKMQEMTRLPMRKVSDQFKETHTLGSKTIDMKTSGGVMKSNYRPSSPERRPTGKFSKVLLNLIKLDSYLDDDDGDGDDGYGDGKGRSTRGLRVLSLKVKEIVSQKKRTSYKEVAETLTYELRQKMASKSAKEEVKNGLIE